MIYSIPAPVEAPLHIVEQLSAALDYIQTRQQAAGKTALPRAQTAILTGSGLSRLAERIDVEFALDYTEIPHFPTPGMRGHPGRLLFGILAGCPLLCFVGRLHTYEGYTALQVAFPVLLAYCLGARKLLLTNAAGAINRVFGVGQLMLISDHINFSGQNPLTLNAVDNLNEVIEHFANAAPTAVFAKKDRKNSPVAAACTQSKIADLSCPAKGSATSASASGANARAANLDMSFAYSAALRKLARQAAQELGIKVQEGVYIGVRGASFETPAEIRAFASWGADAVGMSTVHETTVASRLGMQVLGISLLSNMAAGITPDPISADDIMAISADSTTALANLIERVLRYMSWTQTAAMQTWRWPGSIRTKPSKDRHPD